MKLSNLAKDISQDLPKEIKSEPKRIKKTKTKVSIKKWNAKFVYKIGQARNDIIHNKISPVNNTFSFNFSKRGKFKFSVYGVFNELFPGIENEFENVVGYLLDNFTESILNCTMALIDDIESNRLVDK